MQKEIIIENKKKEYTIKQILKYGKLQNELKIAKRITVVSNPNPKQDNVKKR